MTSSAPQPKPKPETHLQRTLTTALNEVGAEAALAAIFHQEEGPLIEHVSRGFSSREVHAILRTLSTQPSSLVAPGQEGDEGRVVRLRLITPCAKSLLSIPLRHVDRTYGYLVVGRKEGATFAKKDRKSTRLNSSHMSESRMPSSA